MLQVPYFFFSEESPFTTFNIFFGQSCESHTVKSFYMIADMFNNPEFYTVAAAMYLYTKLAFVFDICIGKHIHARHSIFQLYTVEDLVKVFLLQGSVECYGINLFY